MASVDLASQRIARSARVRHTSLVFFTAGSSLFSRASTAGVLIIAARRLSVGGLGLFATLFGIAVAAAYVVASTSGNILAYWTRANPATTTRTVGILAAVGTPSCLLAVPLYLGLGPQGAVAITLATLILTVSGIAATITLQLLRGMGHLKLAVTAGFIIPSVFRLGLSALLETNVTVSQMLGASATAASLGTIVGLSTILALRTQTVHSPTFAYHWNTRLSMAAGIVGLMWFALGQIDLTSLTLIRGSTAGGEYAPTMRAFEAMNALGLAIAFVSIRALAGATLTTAVTRVKRILPPSLAFYAVVTLPLILFGHEILTKMLDRHVFWSPIAICFLAIGYAGNLVMAICFETLASQRATSHLLMTAIIILGISLALTPLAVTFFGVYGAAMGNSLSYLLGGIIVFVLLNRSLHRIAP
jgi:hypothetical protein